MNLSYVYIILGSLLLYTAPLLADQEWRFRLSPYLWFAGVKGNVTTIPGAPSVPIDISPGEALEDAELGVLVMLDAKKGRHGVFTDFIFTDSRSDDELIPPPVNLTMRSKTKTILFTLAYQYEVINQDRFFMDLLAGGRYWDIDSELRFDNGLGILGGRTISNDESWIDPVLGLKGRAPLGNTPFYVAGGAGMGGFGVGSDFFYEINASVGYQWNKAIGTAIGYRLFDVDYENNGYLYDVRQQGWQLGLTWAF